MKRRFCVASAGLALYVTCGSAGAETLATERARRGVFQFRASSATPSAPSSTRAPIQATANGGDTGGLDEERDWSTLPQNAPIAGFPRSPVLSVFYLGLAAGPTSTKSHAAMRDGFAGEFTLGVAFWKEIPLNLGVGAANLGDPLATTDPFQGCNQAGACDDVHDSSSRILLRYGSERHGRTNRTSRA